MALRQFADSPTNPTTTLASPLIATDTALTLASDPGTEMPTTGPFSIIVGENGAEQPVNCASRSGTTVTLVAPWAGSTHAAGSLVNTGLAKIDADAFLQADDIPVTSVAGKTGVVTLDKSDVGLGNVTNDAQVKKAGDTSTGAQGHPAGSASAPSVWVGDSAQGIYRSATNTLALASAGSQAMTLSATLASFPASRRLSTGGGITMPGMIERTLSGLQDGSIGGTNLAADLLIGGTVLTVDDESLLANASVFPRLIQVDSEIMVAVSRISANNYRVERSTAALFGSTEADHYAGAFVDSVDPYAPGGDAVVPTNSGGLQLPNTVLSGDTTIFLPPTYSLGFWTAPARSFEYQILIRQTAGYDVDLINPAGGATIGTFTSSGNLGIEVRYDQPSVTYTITEMPFTE